MCEASAYLKRGEKEELILKDVATVTPEDGKWLLISIFGDQKVIQGNIKEMNLLDHKIVFEETE